MPNVGVFIPDAMTRVEPAALATELAAAWKMLRAETPKRESILILMAHSAHETGHWHSCHNWNLGNVKGRIDDGRDFTFFACWERINGERVWFEPPHPYTRFRAFRTLREGALDHLAFLMGMKRYALAWQHVLEPDVKAFVSALKAGGYFTDDVEIVERSVASIYGAYVNRLPFDPVVPELELDDETKARTMERVALCISELAAQALDEQRHPSEPPPTPRNA